MTISSLANFTVPLKEGTTQGLLMPKLSFRFRVTFTGFGTTNTTTEMTKQIAEAARPVPTFTPFKVEVYNSTINLIGKPTWGAISVTLRDDVNGEVSKLVGEQNQKQFDYMEQSSAAAGVDYKFTMNIEMLDGGNGKNVATVLEEWECTGCLIVSTTYSALKYSEQTAATIVLSIQPDNCIQTGKSGALAGLGSSSVKRTTGSNVTGGGTTTGTAT